MVRTYVIGGVFGVVLGFALMQGASAASSETGGAKPLAVVSSALHAEAPKAEICLTLSAPVEIKDRAKILSFLDLTREGKKQKIAASDLSLTPSEMCVQNLRHRSRYEVTLRTIEGVEKNKLAKPVTIGFDVPDRRPVLNFVGGGSLSALPRHVRTQDGTVSEKDLLRSGMAHVVRSVNVLATHLMLYRVKEREAFSGAWQQFRQINLSPSESLTFARSKGQMVFESDLVFGDAPNEEQTLVAPLPADEALEPGLYYLAAMPRGKSGENPALLAGQWFLVSDLHLTAVRLSGGVQIFAAQGVAEMKPAAKAKVALLARDGHVVVEGETKDDGSVFLATEPDALKEAAVVTGQLEAGAVDVIELETSRDVLSGDLSVQAFMMLDRESYVSGDTAIVTLRAEDQNGQWIDSGESVLKVLRSDKRLYRDFVIPAQTTGVASVAIPLPVLGRNTTWKLVWTRKDGSVLAEGSLSIQGREKTQAEKEVEASGSVREDGVGLVPAGKAVSGLEIKPLFGEQAFAENSLAAFSVSLLDHAGRKRGQGDLYYLVYEEGRSFEWYPAEGHWDYKPLPNQRRIGGGPLTLSATDENTIKWPVTAGHYVLEIVNSEGVVLARQPFDAGRFAANDAHKEDPRLHFVNAGQKLEVKQDNAVKLVLKEPAMVNLLVEDGHVRQTLHRFMKAGENTVSLTPAESWGKQIAVRAEARFAGSPEPVVVWQRLGVRKTADELVFKIAPVTQDKGAENLSLQVQVQRVLDKASSFVSAVVTFAPKEGKAGLPPLVLPAVALDAEGKADLSFAAPKFNGAVAVRLFAWNEKQYGTSLVSVPVHPAIALDGQGIETASVGQRTSLPLLVTNFDAPAGAYEYTIAVPEGVELTSPAKGRLKLVKGGRVPLSVNLIARRFVDERVTLTLVGEGGLSVSESWPLVARPSKPLSFTQETQTLDPQQTLQLAALPAGDQTGQKVVLVSPASLPEISAKMWALMDQTPRSTEEIALWLDTVRLWGDVLVKAGFVSERRLAQAQTARIETLQTRQNADGGFAAARSGDPSDMASTAAAFAALAGSVDPAAGLAAEWLALKLQNTWFDEDERSARALAFAALAHSGKVDLSGLRYFAQTSLDKPLQPVSIAALAYALARVGDESAAKEWQAKAGQALASLPDTDALPVLLRLAQTPLGILPEAVARFEALDKAALSISGRESLCYLSALAYRQEKSGTWRLSVAGKEEKYLGLLPLSLGAQNVEIKNLSDKKLSVLRLVPVPEGAGHANEQKK